MWRYSVVTHLWSTITYSSSSTFPLGRISPSAAVFANAMWIYGGYYNDPKTESNRLSLTSAYFLSDLWSLQFPSNFSSSNSSLSNPSQIQFSWQQIIEPSDAIEFPPELMGCNMAVAGNTSFLFLYGGFASDTYSNDIWRYNGSTHYWTKHVIHFTIRNKPMPRADHGWVFVPYLSAFLLFGGAGSLLTNADTGITSLEDFTYLNDFWMFDLNYCPGGCFSRGVCSYGYCFCSDQYYGVDCQQQTCPGSDCSYDVIKTQRQVCYHCSSKLISESNTIFGNVVQNQQIIQNQGVCEGGSCLCADGWSGSACDIYFCRTNCSYNGVCYERSDGSGQCNCNNQFQLPICQYSSCLSSCNYPNGGYCNENTGLCVCFKTLLGSYSGTDCLFCNKKKTKTTQKNSNKNRKKTKMFDDEKWFIVLSDSFFFVSMSDMMISYDVDNTNGASRSSSSCAFLVIIITGLFVLQTAVQGFIF